MDGNTSRNGDFGSPTDDLGAVHRRDSEIFVRFEFNQRLSEIFGDRNDGSQGGSAPLYRICRTRKTNFVRAEKQSQNFTHALLQYSSLVIFEILKTRGSRWSSSVRAVGSNDSEHHLSRESLATVRSVRGEVKTFDGSAGTMQPPARSA